MYCRLAATQTTQAEACATGPRRTRAAAAYGKTVRELPHNACEKRALGGAVTKQAEHVRIRISLDGAVRFRGFGDFSLTRCQKQIGFQAVLLVVEFAIASGSRIERRVGPALDNFSRLDDQILVVERRWAMTKVVRPRIN